jgi:hypothetical protein
LVAQLAVGEAVGGEAVDDAVGVAELVVEPRADDALRQGVPDVADLLADLIPAIMRPAIAPPTAPPIAPPDGGKPATSISMATTATAIPAPTMINASLSMIPSCLV